MIIPRRFISAHQGQEKRVCLCVCVYEMCVCVFEGGKRERHDGAVRYLIFAG